MSAQQSVRLTYLDFIRGIAVLGLLVMNLPHMGVAELSYVPFSPDLASDAIVRTVNSVLFDGRFRSLFCLLFGIGLYLQYQSYERNGLNPYLVLKTRLNWLFVFGFLHGVLVWPGDILMAYALCGRVILNKLLEPSEALIKKGIIWVVTGFVLSVIFAAMTAGLEPEVSRGSEQHLAAIAAMQQHYFAEWHINLTIMLVYIVTFPFLFMLSLGGVMLIGIGLFKSGQLQHGFSSNIVIKLLAFTLVITSLDVYLANVHLSIWLTLQNLFGALSGLTMALLIWHLIIKTKIHDSPMLLTKAFRSVGQMALSFYIFQSVVGTLLLKVWFPDWIINFSLIDYFCLAILLMVVQLVLASLYKPFFKQGPLEYTWRKLVNKKADSFRLQDTNQ